MSNDYQNSPLNLREANYYAAPQEANEGQNREKTGKNRPHNILNDTVFRQHYYEVFGDQRPVRAQPNKPQQVLALLRKNWAVCLLVLGILVWYKEELPCFSNKKLKNSRTETTAKTTSNTQSDEETPLSIFGTVTSSSRNDLSDLDENIKVAYMRRFTQISINERQKYGVPSSIMLAMALLQSRAGTNEYATRSNNHFAMPCTLEWSGESDQYGEKCLRKYENAWVSFRNFNVMLTSGKFSGLQRLGSKDYKGWAKGLDSLGYPSTVPKLDKALIDLIEKYQLMVFDNK